jgi:hypothetical protein
VLAAGHARLVAPSLAIASGEATDTLSRHTAADGVPHFNFKKFKLTEYLKLEVSLTSS